MQMNHHTKKTIATLLLPIAATLTLQAEPVKPFMDNSDIFKEMQRMQQEMDRVFEHFNQRFFKDPVNKDFFKEFSVSPRLDIRDKGDLYEIKVDLPGSSTNQIDVSAKDHVLTIKAGTVETKEENQSNIIKKERFVNQFQRVETLPEDADESTLKTDFKDGVLTITLKKKK